MSALEQLLGATPRAVFLEERWGRRSLHVVGASAEPASLFSLRDCANVLAFLRPVHAKVRLVEEGVEVLKSDLRDDAVFPEVVRALARGMTLSLERLDLFWPPVVELCGRLAAELGCPVHANAYLTPGSEPGLDPHYDTHDVFALQLEGHKDWSLGQLEATAPTEQTCDGVVAEMRTAERLRMAPGDVLYVPRGMAHCARSAGAHSLHLTIGCIPRTRADELAELVAAAAEHVVALRDTAIAQHRGAHPAGGAAALLAQLAELVGGQALAPPPYAPAQTRRCHVVEDAAAQLRSALEVAAIDEASRFVVRRPEEIELQQRGHIWELRGGQRRAELAEELVPAVQAMMAMPGSFAPSDLPDDLGRALALRSIVRLVSSSFLGLAEEPAR
jgi:hypothetical protein